MKKRGQIAIFFIIAIIIALILMISLYFYKSGVKFGIKSPENIIYENLKSCIYQKAVDGLFYLGERGGYLDISTPIAHYFEIELPIFFDKKSYLPPLTFFEEEFSRYMKEKVNECINDLSIKFKEYEFDIGHRNLVKTQLKEKVFLFVDYSISVSKDQKSFFLKPIEIEIPFNFIEKYKIVKNIIEEHEKFPNSIPIIYLTKLSNEKNFNYELIDLSDGNYVYILYFDTTLKKQPYILAFLISYNFSEFDEDIIVEPIPEFNITKEEIFEYRIKAKGKNLSYYAYTDLFDISPLGWIKFNTSVLPNGRTQILIKISDGKKNIFTYITFNVNITK